jgi:hypothetical protein
MRGDRFCSQFFQLMSTSLSSLLVNPTPIVLLPESRFLTRRGGVVLSALLVIPLVSATYQNWVRENRVYEVEIGNRQFNVSGTVMEGLPDLERNQVIHRIAWLKGITNDDLDAGGQPRPRPGEGPATTPSEDDPYADIFNNWEQPLSPKLEALAQGQQVNLLPSWEETWPVLAGIAILWTALYTGFWIVSGFQSRPAR